MGYRQLFGFAASIIVILAAVILYLIWHNGKHSPNYTQAPAQQASEVSLDYSRRGLSDFPRSILGDTSLTSLDLSHNSLTGALPAEIKNLANLENLDVSYNDMTGIPAEIGQMKNLKVLNYSHNQITGLPLELGNLTQLQVLDLSGNPNVSQQDLSTIRSKLTSTQIKL